MEGKEKRPFRQATVTMLERDVGLCKVYNGVYIFISIAQKSGYGERVHGGFIVVQGLNT